MVGKVALGSTTFPIITKLKFIQSRHFFKHITTIIDMRRLSIISLVRILDSEAKARGHGGNAGRKNVLSVCVDVAAQEQLVAGLRKKAALVQSFNLCTLNRSKQSGQPLRPPKKSKNSCTSMYRLPFWGKT